MNEFKAVYDNNVLSITAWLLQKQPEDPQLYFGNDGSEKTILPISIGGIEPLISWDKTDAGRLKILHIEDDDIYAEHFARSCKKYGCHSEIYRIADGRNALDIFDNLSKVVPADLPDFIVLDLGLPYMSGFELIELIRDKYQKAFERVAIFVLTGSVSQKDKDRASMLKLEGYFCKDDPISDFFERVLNIFL